MELSGVPHLRPVSSEPDQYLLSDPEVERASAWLAKGSADPSALVIGIPFAGGSISKARCDLAPSAVRKALSRFTVWSSDFRVSLASFDVGDVGDIDVDEEVEKTQSRIEEAIGALIGQKRVPLVALGGDNSVTVGLARGTECDGLVTIDAHHDCRNPAPSEGGPNNGTPVRQLIEGGIRSVAQIGIHGFANSQAHARWAEEHGVAALPASVVRHEGINRAVELAVRAVGKAERIWLDVDLDSLDRAFAPGAPAALPGGLHPADVERAAFLIGRDPRTAGMDIVEFDPTQDVADTTARTACAILLAFLAGVASRS